MAVKRETVVIYLFDYFTINFERWLIKLYLVMPNECVITCLLIFVCHYKKMTERKERKEKEDGQPQSMI